MTYKTTTGETPKTAMIRVLGATLLALALLLGLRAPASAQSVRTTHAGVTLPLAAFAYQTNPRESVVSDRLSQLSIDMADVQKIFYTPQLQSGRGGNIIVGYDAWVTFHSCKGYLVIDLTRHFRVRQVYTRGGCRVPGVRHF